MMSPRQFVVGVDGSECSLQALRWAVAEAGQHGAELVAMTTWTALPPPIVYPTVEVSKIGSRADVSSAAERALKSIVTEALANDPQIAVQTVAVEGDPTA
jgi:nucleotide-binding universal stress UspA family protein